MANSGMCIKPQCRWLSLIWDNLFPTDRDADAAFRDVLAQEGLEAFLGK
ncbi:hypothetical protein [Sphingobium xenophagum]|uniref:Uncharacterized protein n=1 Tax=Sphingobium xenophagum TaxID=121428 RepID=A0A401J775_SPHXE|nr:hypothetical protein [Sphingobium xenophagum]GBH32509.1 hypothetical protein MBESOW_P3740 [Sphingobium xenophagum]